MPRKTLAIFHPGGRINDLRGRTFGLVTVRHFAGKDKWNRAKWCVACKCLTGCKDCQGAGCTFKVLGTKLVQGKTMSCGCSRTDSEVRKRAAMRVPVKVRKARAQKAAEKCRGSHPPPAYRLTVSQAANLLNVATDRVVELAKQGILRSVYRKTGAIKISATDVAEYIGDRATNPKECPLAKDAA